MNIKWGSKWEDNHELASMFDEESHQWLSAELKQSEDTLDEKM